MFNRRFQKAMPAQRGENQIGNTDPLKDVRRREAG